MAQPNGESFFYQKRQLVPGLETPTYIRGERPLTLAGGVMIAICKDLDFPSMIRSDVASTSPRLIAAPAWDFDADGWSHARIAILRGVENGLPLARTARNGVLTITDRYGQLIAQDHSIREFTIVVGDVPAGSRSNGTLYTKLGDLFGWLCVALGVVLAVASAITSTRNNQNRRSQ